MISRFFLDGLVTNMGLKKTSSTLIISASVTESAANTFTEAQVTLALDPLNQEVFVIQAINLDVSEPQSVAGSTTRTGGSVSTTSRTSLGSISDNNVVATARDTIVQNAGSLDGAAFSRNANESYQADGVDWIGIIATDDCFLQVEGANNTAAGTLAIKMYGFRAKMDAAGYAAMVQSELLSD